MRQVVLPRVGTVAAWRREARALAAAGVPAEEVIWSVGGASGDLFAAGGEGGTGALPGPRDICVKKKRGRGCGCRRRRSTRSRARCAIRTRERFARGYRLVLRLSRGEAVWGDRADADVGCVLRQAKAVGRDIHKMHAFVRFREVEGTGARRAFAAWFEPEHTLRRAGHAVLRASASATWTG